MNIMSLIFIFLLMLSSFIMKMSSLHLIDLPPMECSQKGLSCKVQVGNCSDDGWVRPRIQVPGRSEVTSCKVIAKKDKSGQFVPVLHLTWTQSPNGGIFFLNGTEVRVVEMATNYSVCVHYIFLNKLSGTKNPRQEMWTFSLDRVAVKPDFKYQVFVTNLPKPDIGSFTTTINVTVPESIWDPNLTWSVENNKYLVLTVYFKPGEFSDQYRVSIDSADLHPEPSHIILKDSQPFKEQSAIVKVKFPIEARKITRCSLDLVIKPLSVQCINNCLDYRKRVDICPFLPDAPVFWIVLGILGPLLGILAVVGCCTVFLQHKDLHKEIPTSDSSICKKSKLEWNPIQEHRKVLIIYSLDHPLYKEIILKLCAFLRAKCGTDVMLDLLDSTWISTIGKIQWLDMQREHISRSSDKVLILCSPGVFAKWKAMCDRNRVRLKEDARSPIGDMLTPALSLIIPDLVQAPSFHKYIVAYFDDVCNERDVPAPFNVVVKYQLMKHFEELYFRILDIEKYEPGRIKSIEGIREFDYFNCPSGRALQNAIEAFQNYQLKNPNWFEMELLDTDDEEETTSSEETAPTDINYNDLTLSYQLNEENEAFANMITLQNVEEHVLMSSLEDKATNIKLNEHSLAATTDTVEYSTALSSFAGIDLKGLQAQKTAEHYALCLTPQYS